MKHRKLNIAQVTPYFYPACGGIENATFEVSKRLVKLGHRVTVYTSKSNFSDFNTLPNEEIIEGIVVKRFPEHFNIMGTWFPKISADEDVIHLQNYNIHPHTYLIAKYHNKKPVVVTFHGGFSQVSPYYPFTPTLYGVSKYFWQYLFGRRYLRKIDILIALNEWEKQDLIFKCAPEDRFRILPNGLGTESFEDCGSIKMDKPYIFNMCRISLVKSLDHIIKVLPSIPDVYYVVAGTDPSEGTPELERLRKLVKELNLEDRVFFVGTKTGAEKYRYISGALAVVISSEWEMLSITILEAMAQGRIVIASDNHGNQSIVKNRKNGFIYKYGDLEALKNLVIRALKLDPVMVKCASAAKKEMFEKYRWDSIVGKLEEIYCNVT